jgi:hypothetical protein
MLNTLDDGLQWLVLLKVYGEEVWILPLVAAAILITKGRTGAVPLRIALLLLFLTYVVVFRMHWHSWLAVPILVFAIASDVVRDHWYRLFGDLRTTLRDGTGASSDGDPRQRHYRLLLWLVPAAALVATFIYFDAPADLWAIFIAVIMLAGLFALLPLWRRLAEARFRLELRRDPRLGRYLDWVRWTRMRAPADRQSLLAENWVARARDHAEPSGMRLRLARCLVRRRRMMTIESAFVSENLRRERERAWQAFQNVLHGGSVDPRQDVPRPIASISEILASDNGEAMLLNWLAMTEALAECMAFVNDRAGDATGARPGWLEASELLAHAGEIEHEIVLDLKREARAASAAIASSLGAQILQHQVRTSRYFDLAACCVENHLEPGSGVPGAPLDVRWRRVIGERTAWRRPPPVQDAKAAEETLWRIVLALRYQLLDTLSPQDSDVPKARHAVNLFRGDIGSEPSVRLLGAVLARDAAESSLWISAQQGDPSSRWAFDDRRPWADRLRQVDYWQARLRHRRLADHEHCAMAESALGRVVHLWGLAIEQDLDVLRPGTDIWRDRLESAGDFFIYEGSPRVRRLAARVERQAQSPAVFDQIIELV